MTLDEYQSSAIAFANDDLVTDTALGIWALGLAGESGEVADQVKKYLGHGHPLDKDHLIKELGDVLWYVAKMADQLDCNLELIAQQNLEKLRDRYGDKFSVEASVNRAPN